MAVLDALRRMQGFTNTEQDLARFILDNLDDVLQMNISDLSGATFTSTATVVRLCRKLGVSGYRDFRIALAGDVEQARSATFEVNPDFPFLEGSNTHDIIQSVSQLTKQAAEACEEAAEETAKAVEDVCEDTAETCEEAAEELADKAAEAAETAEDVMQDAPAEATEAFQEAVAAAEEEFRETGEAAAEILQDNPEEAAKGELWNN